ncbi:MAG: hypothetical protein ACD_60C00106G0001 [uncultured bacterium]|nr:MAG: hypothetical protein ACD_60C00106G0001 [uncultured bacterium]
MANARIQELEQLQKQQDEMILQIAQLQEEYAKLLEYKTPEDLDQESIQNIKNALNEMRAKQKKLINFGLEAANTQKQIQRLIQEERAQGLCLIDKKPEGLLKIVDKELVERKNTIAKCVGQQKEEEESEKFEESLKCYQGYLAQASISIELARLEGLAELERKKEEKEKIEISVNDFKEKLTYLEGEVNKFLKRPEEIKEEKLKILESEIKGDEITVKDFKIKLMFIDLRKKAIGVKIDFDAIISGQQVVELKVAFDQLKATYEEKITKMRAQAPKEIKVVAEAPKPQLKKPVPAQTTHEKRVEEIVKCARKIFGDDYIQLWQRQSFSFFCSKQPPTGVAEIRKLMENPPVDANNLLSGMIEIVEKRMKKYRIRSGLTKKAYNGLIALSENGKLKKNLSEEDVSNFKRTFGQFLKKEENQSRVVSVRRAKV